MSISRDKGEKDDVNNIFSAFFLYAIDHAFLNEILIFNRLEKYLLELNGNGMIYMDV